MLFWWVCCPKRFVSVATVREHLPKDHVIIEGYSEDKEGE